MVIFMYHEPFLEGRRIKSSGYAGADTIAAEQSCTLQRVNSDDWVGDLLLPLI